MHNHLTSTGQARYRPCKSLRYACFPTSLTVWLPLITLLPAEILARWRYGGWRFHGGWCQLGGWWPRGHEPWRLLIVLTAGTIRCILLTGLLCDWMKTHVLDSWSVVCMCFFVFCPSNVSFNPKLTSQDDQTDTSSTLYRTAVLVYQQVCQPSPTE